ncbi:MAG: S9 family peptidase [Gemmataceae bacterium]|nr:S9 family peptidase [Gemmataceae bacterium]
MYRAIIVSLTLLISSAGFAEEPKDPFQWLEDVAGEKSLTWVKERNAVSTGELTKSPEFKALEERLLKILDSKDRIPLITKSGPWFYNFWRDDKNKRGLWRRTTMQEYRKLFPIWETVLDLDELCAKEKENWVWHGANFLQPKHERCLIALSRGGADADVKREFDMSTKLFVKDGFLVPEAKSQVSWKNPDTLYVATDFGPNTLTKSGYPRITKEWKRGTPFASAQLIYEGEPDDMRAIAGWDLTPGFEREFASRRIGFYSGETFIRRAGKFVKVDKPDDADVSWHQDLMYFTPRTDWKVGDKTYPGGSLLAVDFDGFMGGKRNFDVLFEPTERKSLAGFSPTKTKVILNELDNVCNHLYVLTRSKTGWKRETLAGTAPLSSANASAVDSDESDDYFMTGSNYLNPSSLHFGTLGGKPAEKLKSGPTFFDTKGLEITQHEIASKDGTKIPYFQVARKDLKLDGTNPTLLYGYGGFEISMLPAYNPAVGAAWLEKGGVYVVANIRGGGEFGPKWHQAALKEKRNRCYEDFAAVAEDLVKRKITTPKHLGTMGGSNGGLLMGNMLTQYPDKFGAIVCAVPLLDMQRYHKLLAGASWMAEYGNPDTKDWEFMKSFSAYQNVSAGMKYPRTLFTTSTRDDRVHPGHARKMAAKMLEQGHDVLLYENIEGGHGGAADNKQAAFMQALSYSFLRKQVK